VTLQRILLAAAAGLAMAASPAGYDHWTAKQLSDYDKALPGKMSAQKIGSQVLGKYGNHLVQLVHREGSGEAELHETQADVMFIRAGEASLVVGGSMRGSKTTAPNEQRGPKIEGGEKQALHAGDIVHIPSKTPHQMLLDSGKTVDYAIVKVDTP